jgi:hypothetical protein
MIRSTYVMCITLVLSGLMGVAALGQTAQDVCAYIESSLAVSSGLKAVLCQDIQAGITRGHIQPARALQLLQEVNKRVNPNTQMAAETLLATVGFIVNPTKGDLPAELLIRRTFEIFSREQTPGESMGMAAQEATALGKMLQSVGQIYRGLGIQLEPNVSSKALQTEFGEIPLTVLRVDTVITATAVALDRFERKLDRQLDDSDGMKAEVMRELRTPSFTGAETLPASLLQYIEAHTTGREWAPIVRQLAADRGRTS